MSSFNRIILGIFLLALAAGATLSTLIYIDGQRVLAAGTALTERSLPRFTSISHLRNAIFSLKPILYEYYATADRDRYWTAFEHAKEQARVQLSKMKAMQQALPQLARIETHLRDIEDSAYQLDISLSASDIDWDSARHTLAKISDMEQMISPELDA